MPTATARQVRKRAAELGVTIEDNCDHMSTNWMQDVTIDAPRGFVFGTTGTHHCVATKGCGGVIPKGEVWGYVLDDMSMGLQPCDEKDCDICNEPEGGW